MSRYDYCVVDVETANAARSSICQIGIAVFAEGRMIESWQSLVNPETNFNAFNVQLHGIGPETVAEAPRWAEILPEVERLLAGEAVASHSDFDRAALNQACARDGLREVAYARWIDTCRIARAAWPELPNHKLPTLARCFGIVYKAHDALEDARVAGEILTLALDHHSLSIDDLLRNPNKHIGALPQANYSPASSR